MLRPAAPGTSPRLTQNGHGPLFEVRPGHVRPTSYLLCSHPEVPPPLLDPTWLGREVLGRITAVYVDADPSLAGAVTPQILVEQDWTVDAPLAMADLACVALEAVELPAGLLTFASPLTLALLLQHCALDYGDRAVCGYVLELVMETGRSVVGLDSPAELLAALGAVPLSEHYTLLRRSIHLWIVQSAKRRALAAQARRDYLAGGLGLPPGTSSLETIAPAGHRHLVRARTERWGEVLDEVMTRKPILVCVGPEHFAGEHGLLEGLVRRSRAREPDGPWTCGLVWEAAS